MGSVASAAGGLASGAKGLVSGLGGGALFGPKGGSPEGANIQQGTSIGDVQGAQQGAQNSLESQKALLSALQAQNGLGQQNVAGQNQLGLANQLAGANGVGIQQNAVNGLQNTAGMYQNIASGRGPNPAQAMLQQATGQNVANQAALMAGQRGAGSNVGLMARQAAQTGAGIQQQAVGQGATMQANQQLNALSGLTNAQQAVGGLGSNLTNQQAGANQAYANQANQVAGQQIGATTTNAQANLANQQSMQGALQGVNNSNVASQASMNAGNVDLSKTNTGGLQSVTGGVLQGAGKIIGMAHGGQIYMAEGGDPTVAAPQAAAPAASGPASFFGKFLQGATSSGGNNEGEGKESSGPSTGADSLRKGTADLIGSFKGKPKGQDGTTLATGDIGFGPSQMAPAPADDMGPATGSPSVMMSAKGGLAKKGGHVTPKSPSQRAEKKGDSYSNDKVPAMLSAGEIVLPRSVTQSKDPVGAASKFVAQVLAKRKVKS